MFQCKKILFPIALSRDDEATAPFVLSMARRYQAQVLLLHVIQPAPPAYTGMGGVYPEVFDFEGLRGDLLIEVRRFAAAQLPKVDTWRRLPAGTARVGYSRGSARFKTAGVDRRSRSRAFAPRASEPTAHHLCARSEARKPARGRVRE